MGRRGQHCQRAPGLSLHEALAARGWSSAPVPTPPGTRTVYDGSGAARGSVTAREAWALLNVNACPCGRTFTTPQGLGLHFRAGRCKRGQP